MRIDDLNRTPATPGAEKSEQTAQEHPAEKEVVSSSDQAEVSHLAQSLAAPDSSRVEQLRLQVQSASYDVSAQVVANSLIDAHLRE
jgi:anti-sigma28 factor (negative regulator of flagellin synthesis)